MEAGYRMRSFVREEEVGGARVCADLGNGNVMCFAGGMVYNSADGKWRLEDEQRLEFADGEMVWTDGTGLVRRDFEVEACVGDVMVENEEGDWALFSREGRLKEAFFAGEGRFRYAYADGVLMASQGPRGRRVFGYADGRCTVIAGAETAFFEYDGDVVTKVRRSDGREVKFEYEKGRISAVISGGERLEIEYDWLGRAMMFGDREIEYGDGWTAWSEWRYMFDRDGNYLKAEKITGSVRGN